MAKKLKNYLHRQLCVKRLRERIIRLLSKRNQGFWKNAIKNMISPINEIMFLFVTIKYLRLPTHLFKAKHTNLVLDDYSTE